MPDQYQADSALDFLRCREVDPPVTVVRELRVRAGDEGRFELLMGAFLAEAGRQPGHLGATVLRPADTGGAYRFVYKFDSRSKAAAWHGSALRASLFAPVAEVVMSDRVHEFPGLETWVEPVSGRAGEPPKWKGTLLSWAAIYSLVVLFSYVLAWTGLKLSIPIAALVLTGVIVPLVSYVVGPALGRLFHGWLHAGQER